MLLEGEATGRDGSQCPPKTGTAIQGCFWTRPLEASPQPSEHLTPQHRRRHVVNSFFSGQLGENPEITSRLQPFFPVSLLQFMLLATGCPRERRLFASCLFTGAGSIK